MEQTMNNIQNSINVIVSIDNKVVGGQLGATLSRSSEYTDITNKINGEWAEYLPTIKVWSIHCNGLYVKDNTAYELLEDAFMNNNTVSVEFAIGSKKWRGQALIVDFPLNAVYNQSFKYNLKLLGDGPLQ